MAKARYAILLDGGYLTKKLHSKLKRPPTSDDIVAECDRLRAIEHVKDYELLRIYYYDAFPAAETIKMPVSRADLNLSATERYRFSQSLFDQLVIKPQFALRMGTLHLAIDQWKMKPRVARQLIAAPRALADDDFILNINQKGVDMRVGMDMARLALRELVQIIIVVTGDSDFVPAFKFVRREGVLVILDPLGQNIRVDLRHHADIVL